MAEIKKFVSYLRVSTDKQGRSGLGLEAQRAAVAAFLGDTKPLGEYVEVESGRDDARPQLQVALHRAKVTGAVLVIAKLDRLSRNVGFIARLQESGVRFVCADMPDATELTVNIFASLAQHERQVISKRTKDAMAAAKALGRAFGNPNGARALLGLSNRPAVDAIKARADKHARDVLPIILDIMAVGISSLPGIANELKRARHPHRTQGSVAPDHCKQRAQTRTAACSRGRCYPRHWLIWRRNLLARANEPIE